MSGSAHLDLVRWGRQGKGKGEGKGSGREGEGRRKEGGRKHITFIKSRGPDVGGKSKESASLLQGCHWKNDASERH